MRFYDSDLGETAYNDIIPVNYGMEYCEPNHSFGPAVRHHWLLHFVANGHGKFVTPRGEYTLGRGDIFVIRPYEITFYQADGEDPWTYVWIGFETSHELPMSFDRDVISMPDMEGDFRRLGEYGLLYGAHRGMQDMVLSVAYCLLSRLFLAEDPERAGAEGYVNAALTIIKAEYSNPLTVGSIADRLHVNRQHLQRIFKAAMGLTPGAYLTSVRMSRAVELIEKGGYSLSVISASVGYSDPFVFSRAFKKHTGLSPQEYRRGLRSTP